MAPETQQLPVLRSVEPQASLELIQNPSGQPVRRGHTSALAARTALVTVGFGVCIGIPMIHPSRYIDTFAASPGITGTDDPSASPSPVIFPSDVPVNTPQSESIPPPIVVIPSPVFIASLCETQEGTVEGQLSSGEPVLPATMDRPSIFVVSPDRSTEQSFSVRPAGASDADWSSISVGSDVGIIGIATADTIFSTGNGRAVWAKSCEQTSRAAVDEVVGRTGDLCRRAEFGFRAVVVYHVGADGRPVEMSTTEC